MPKGIRGKPLCSVEECGKPAQGQGYCDTHYARWRKSGSPYVTKFIRGDDVARFWSKVDRRGDDECWPWLGWLTPEGYGRFRLGRRNVLAHRYAYELMIGPVPDEMTIDHVWAWGCLRKDCVNALAHMEPVPHAVNGLRGFGPSARNARKTYCDNGHEFTPDNTYVSPVGYRSCRVCARERNRAHKAKQKSL